MIIVLIVAVFTIVCPLYKDWFNTIVLSLTLVVLIWYAYDTHRIANQSVEANLRSVILRSGWISKWEDIKFRIENGQLNGEPLQFTILKNIAKDITGYIVLNNKKYELLFANEISQINDKESSILISDLEKKIMLHLYEVYDRIKSNPRWKILDAYRDLGIKEDNYVGMLNNSKYIKTDGEYFQLTDEGIRLMDTEKPKAFAFLPKWGWMKPDTLLYAIFNPKKFEKSSEDNCIYITYRDIGGNSYFTRENKDFSQTSGKL